MPNVKGLLADPEFNKLDPGAQRHVLGQVDPQFEQLSDADYQMFRQKVGPQAEPLPEGVNYGKDTSGQGFWAHATQTLRDLPDAVLSGRVLTGIPGSIAQGMRQGMQNYIQNPSLHTAINTVPIVGPMLTRPFETGQSGDTAGAWGDAVDIGGQLLAGRALGAIPRVTEPIQAVEQPLGPGLSTPPGPPTLPPIPAGLRTVADWTLPVPHRVQQLAGHAYEYARGKSGAPAKTTETRMMDVRPFDTRISPSGEEGGGLSSPPEPFIPADLKPKKSNGRAGGSGDGFQLSYSPENFSEWQRQQVGAPPADAPTPATLTRRDLEELGQLSMVREFERAAQEKGSGKGATPGQYDAPVPKRSPVETGGSHVPDYQHPGPSPEEILRNIKAPPKTFGPTAVSESGNARFTSGQYDAPKIQRPPVETGGGHVPDYQHPGPSPEAILRKIEEDRKIEAARKVAEAAAKTTQVKKAAPVVAPPPAPIAAETAPAPLAPTAEQSLPGGRAVVGEGQIPVRQHETNVKVDEQIKNKVNNLAEYLRSKGGTPEHLDMIVKDPDLTKQYLREAHAYGTNRGNPVPKTVYKGLDPGSDTHMQVRQRILDMIEEEKNKP